MNSAQCNFQVPHRRRLVQQGPHDRQTVSTPINSTINTYALRIITDDEQHCITAWCCTTDIFSNKD